MAAEEELVREAWRRWNAGDRELDPDLFDPEMEVHSALTGGVYRGVEGVGRWISEIDDQFDRWEVEIEAATVLGDGRVAARGWIRARGRESGLSLDEAASWIVDVRGGRIAAIHNFLGHEAEREARAEAEGTQAG